MRARRLKAQVDSPSSCLAFFTEIADESRVRHSPSTAYGQSGLVMRYGRLLVSNIPPASRTKPDCSSCACFQLSGLRKHDGKVSELIDVRNDGKVNCELIDNDNDGAVKELIDDDSSFTIHCSSLSVTEPSVPSS